MKAVVEQDAPIPRLIERTGPNVGRVHPLGDGAHVVGRERGVEVALEGPDVSRKHAEIHVAPGSVRIEDLRSKNGVSVDGQPVHGSIEVEHGARIEIGGVELELIDPSSRLDRALRGAGEVTVTHRRARDAPSEPTRGLLLPAMSLLLFGLAALALWWFS